METTKLPRARFNAKRPGSLVGNITAVLEYLSLLYAKTAPDADSPHETCTTCKGTGTIAGDIDPGSMIAPELSLQRGSVLLWAGTDCKPVAKIKALAAMIGIDFERPLDEQDKRFADILLYGYDAEPVSYVHKGKSFKSHYRGCAFDLQFMRDAGTASKGNLRAIAFFSTKAQCPACNGNEPKLERQAAALMGRSLQELWRLPVAELLRFVRQLPASPDDNARMITSEIAAEIESILTYLQKIGLKTLLRESQHVRPIHLGQIVPASPDVVAAARGM
ncbi:excinuclease ABC subunit UvrA [Paenibacillus silvisoli]|uniref:hypothetical protein n=1 Tax=Paenibacillus silvisoli TaxID=3110539 RepID=UPI002804DD32|nr:hypothetical protein [Paenibacillus silvisoli]